MCAEHKQFVYMQMMTATCISLSGEELLEVFKCLGGSGEANYGSFKRLRICKMKKISAEATGTHTRGFLSQNGPEHRAAQTFFKADLTCRKCCHQ